MAAGVPIVPIVIRNAEVISARDSSTLHPGTVDVVVYPPLSLEDWTLENLSDRIAEVRQLYIDTLTAWPAGAVPEAKAVRQTGQRRRPPRRAPSKKAAAKTPAKKAAAKTSATPPKADPDKKVRGRR